MKKLTISFLSFILVISVTSIHAAKSIKISVKRKPADKTWKVYDTRTIKHLEGFKPDASKYKLDKYGGLIGRKYPATGFFYVKKIEDRFWLIDPEGYTCIHIGLCSVSQGKSRISREAARNKYPTDQAWAHAANQLLHNHGFNGTGAWTPDPQRMNMWVRESNRPFIITEWYAKGMDSGLPNNSGAGWTVKTQADRGRFYQNFTLALLESKQCVGWHWFKYRDNNPLDTSTDPSNRDSNKGIVNWNFQPYTPLLNAQKEINLNAYSLIDYFDK